MHDVLFVFGWLYMLRTYWDRNLFLLGHWNILHSNGQLRGMQYIYIHAQAIYSDSVTNYFLYHFYFNYYKNGQPTTSVGGLGPQHLDACETLDTNGQRCINCTDNPPGGSGTGLSVKWSTMSCWGIALYFWTSWFYTNPEFKYSNVYKYRLTTFSDENRYCKVIAITFFRLRSVRWRSEYQLGLL